jgi:hypothetical protein
MKTLINVNQHVIRHNKRNGTALPPCRVQRGRKTLYCQGVVIRGESRLVYRPDSPLACGARLWIETDAKVELIEEVEYASVRDAMKRFK